jgi:hypothetical protein
MSGDVVEENRIGQRSDMLAWFWRTGDPNQDQENNWMNECKQCPGGCIFLGLIQLLVQFTGLIG